PLPGWQANGRCRSWLLGFSAFGGGRDVDRPRGDDATVLPTAVLHRALLGVVVHTDDPEPLGVAPRPLEVVQQRPVEVAAHVHALLDRVEDGGDVTAQELGALDVVDALLAALLDDLVVVGGAVLGHVQDGAGG